MYIDDTLRDIFEFVRTLNIFVSSFEFDKRVIGTYDSLTFNMILPYRWLIPTILKSIGSSGIFTDSDAYNKNCSHTSAEVEDPPSQIYPSSC